MNIEILDILIKMRDEYGEELFHNITRTNNLLKDLAPHMPKERLQVRNILEMGGFEELKKSEAAYPIIKNKLIKNYAETYCVENSVAVWTVELIAAVIGFDEKPMHKAEIKLAFSQDYARCLGAGVYHSVALKMDGTVVATGNNECGQCNVSTWRNIIAVAAGGFHTIGVKRDNTVITVGDNLEGQCEVSNWTDISTVYASTRHTVGLKTDGRVIACGRNKDGECDVSHWRNIIHVVVDFGCTYGIKKDGTVVAAGDIPYDRYDITALTNVSDLAGMRHRGLMIALKESGTAVKPRRSATKWNDIAALTQTKDCFVGLTKNGKAKILEYYWASSGVECSLDEWEDLIAVCGGGHHMLGLTSSGRVLATMLDGNAQNDEGQCELSNWENVGLPI